MASPLGAFLVSFLIGTTLVQHARTSLMDVIKDLFNTNEVLPTQTISSLKLNTKTKPTSTDPVQGLYKSCGVQKECVPRWLCKGGQIVTDGQVILNTRFSGAVCDPIDICCHISDMAIQSQNLINNVSGANEVQRITTNSAPEPYSQSQLFPPVVGGLYRSCDVQRECVPRWLCREGEIVTDGQVILNTRFAGAVCDTLEICCHISNKTTELVEPFVQPMQHEGCGYQNLVSIGFQTIDDQDNKAQYGEFPWVVAILRDAFLPGKFYSIYECGGALLAPTVVLTAAHCVQDRQAELLLVRAGEWVTQLELQSPLHQERRVKKILVHEKFNKGLLSNDIALLFVRNPFQWERNVRPICLPQADAVFDNANCYAIGWGREKLRRQSTYPESLKKINVSFVPRDQCQASLRTTRLGRNFQLDESFMCAGSEMDKQMFADAGTFLVCAVPGMEGRFRQAGIDAWGTGYGERNIPRVFVNVAHLRKWLDDKLLKNGIDSSEFTL